MDITHNVDSAAPVHVNLLESVRIVPCLAQILGSVGSCSGDLRRSCLDHSMADSAFHNLPITAQGRFQSTEAFLPTIPTLSL